LIPVADPSLREPWQRKWASKVTDPAGAAMAVQSGDRVFVGAGAGTPRALIEALAARGPALEDVELIHIMTAGSDPTAAASQEGHFRHAAMFIGANVRDAVNAGRADYIPVHLSEIPALFETRHRHPDVAFVSVTPPRPDGRISLGAALDINRAALLAADLVVGQVNRRQPWTNGEAVLSVDDFDLLVEAHEELPEVASKRGEEVAERIGRQVARLVEDGSTLQAGIGSIPDAALDALHGRTDLGIHTEMLSDGMADLIESGAVTNRRKALDPGLTVTSFVYGTRRAYDFVDGRPDLAMRPSSYTNDPHLIARQPRMVSINGAIEVDLTGQVCADSIGGAFYSGFGGQVDFIRGAARSQGGLPIVALPSTAAKGEASRIVSQLRPGAGVVTSRADVHFVVTEYGTADLHGKSVRERAMALIAIGHPRFRARLMEEAKALSLVFRDQLMPAGEGPLYPQQFESSFTAKGGERVFIRPVRPTDEDLVREFFYSLTPETLYRRFAGVRSTISHAERLRLTNVDYESEMTLLAVTVESGHERLVGIGSFYTDAARNSAETAFLIADEFQGKGLGTALFRRLADIARTKGLRTVTAQMQADNFAMRRVLERSGLPLETDKATGRVSALLR
jgi:acyl-CoA hydrolase/RimJ/RimL family protein N-acetyltransferase